MSFSEENGGADCLDFFPGRVNFFAGNAKFNQAHDEGSSSGERLKVPHMGWNQVEQVLAHPLWHNIDNNGRFYFVHSYFVEPENKDIIAGRTHYGIEFCRRHCSQQHLRSAVSPGKEPRQWPAAA